MAVDSEINVNCAHSATAQSLRKNIWSDLTDKTECNGFNPTLQPAPRPNESMGEAFKWWKKLAEGNQGIVTNNLVSNKFTGHIVKFRDERSSSMRHG